MTDPDPTQINPRPLVLDGLPTPYGLRCMAVFAGDPRLRAALRTLADRLPGLLAAEAELERQRAVAESKRHSDKRGTP